MSELFDLSSRVAVSSQWEPISTAPQDGSGVFAWREGWDRPSWVRWVFNPRTGTEFWNDVGEWDDYELESKPPTHWLALPDLPTC